MIAEGNSGLREAVLRYKPAKGYKFSTYAVWWIRQRINKYLCTSTRTVKVPTHVQEEGFAINRAAVKLRLELGRDPEAAELAASLSTTETRIESVKTHLQQSFTLDAPFREEDLDNIEYSTQYLLKDTYSDMPDALAEVSDLKDVITNALDCDGIDDRAKRVIIMRFGLDGDEPKTLEAIGIEFGVTRERIRQIQNGALVILNRYLRQKKIGYLG